MIHTVLKRDGSQEPFCDGKIQRAFAKCIANGKTLASVIEKVKQKLPDNSTTRTIRNELIQQFIKEDTYQGQLLAGYLYAGQLQLEINGSLLGEVKTIGELHRELHAIGLMTVIDYSDAEYEWINAHINHSRDYICTWSQLVQGYKKYAICNRITLKAYETRQMALMRVAMVTHEHTHRSRRCDAVLELYELLSNEVLSAPTPNHNNMGTGHNGFFSCCLFTCRDDKNSIATNTVITEAMTYMSAGIGGNMQVRSITDPVDKGRVMHGGKLPYYNALAGIVKSGKQGARGGSMNQYYPAFDPEVQTIMRLVNPRTPVDRRNRKLDFTMMLNQFFLEKSAKDEDIFTFNVFTAPDLYNAFYSKDISKFVELYNKYENDPNFVKNYISARDVVVGARSEGFETGRFFKVNIDHINTHTPFRDPILSSNLCTEITQPTHPYSHISQLYTRELLAETVVIVSSIHDRDQSKWERLVFKSVEPIMVVAEGGHDRVSAYELKTGDVIEIGNNKYNIEIVAYREQEPEISLCGLAAINPVNCKSDEDYYRAAYNALAMIDTCIETNSYPFHHMGICAKARRNAGVGLINVAHYMALKGVKYNTPEGYKELHKLAERHMYWLIKASLQLGRERGVAEWMHKTDWPRGWTPLKTYTRKVDGIADFELQYDWVALSKELIEAGGIRNSSLVAHMPSESSSKYLRVTNGLMGLRYTSINKSDDSNAMEWVAPDADVLADTYTYMWDLTVTEQVKVYSIFQKWADQSISADFFKVVGGNSKFSATELVNEVNQWSLYGVKSWYYTVSATADTAAINSALHRPENVNYITFEQKSACTGGGCEI